MKRMHLFILLSLFALLVPSAAALAESAPPGTNSALAWLQSQQQPDGGFAGLGPDSDPSTTVDVVIAAVANGVDPHSLITDGHSPIDFLEASSADYGSKTAGAVKLTLAAAAAGIDPRDFAGHDLVGQIDAALDPATGLYDPQLYIHAFAILAVVAAGAVPADAAIDALLAHQAANGGWAFTGSTEPADVDSNTTAMAIQALAATGHRSSKAIEAGLGYLRAAQDVDGSFAYQAESEFGTDGDANSTALAIQAILAAGQDPASSDWGGALDALRQFQNEDGSFRYQDAVPGPNLLSTVQAIPALALKPMPVLPAPHVPEPDVRAAATAPAEPNAACAYYAETQHNLCAGFQAFWQEFGGLSVYGFPITEEFDEDGVRVQYFERARFEWRPGSAPERYDVALGLLGRELTAGIDQGAAFEQAARAERDECVYFAETQHNLCTGFRAYWDAYGGLAAYGYPISEEFVEAGQTVQYFERARLEWHPGSVPARFDVLAGRIGAELLGAD